MNIRGRPPYIDVGTPDGALDRSFPRLSIGSFGLNDESIARLLVMDHQVYTELNKDSPVSASEYTRAIDGSCSSNVNFLRSDLHRRTNLRSSNLEEGVTIRKKNGISKRNRR